MTIKHITLSSIAEKLSDDDRSALSKLFPGWVEKASLGGVVVGLLLFSGYLFFNFEHRNTVGAIGLVLAASFSLVWMLVGIFRDTKSFVGEVKRPLDSLDNSYQRHLWAVAALKSVSVEDLGSAHRFVVHRLQLIPKNIGFLVGSVEFVGLVPLLLAAWWAWRSAGAPVDFSFFEKLILSFASGIYIGTLLVRSKLATLSRVEHVLAEAIQARGPQS
ncbi:hypothetical protein M2650_01695 [Luteimonas sp. SX5]|uniref:Uncharacterized protein n=1 Tax=Luteimonas galliterrae TaxID=2940486 RepID=A0ABT0MER8_9GAMM|nr:hypothetical protein [Luteimonas galliterrae]MCL1633360.1 hypothetical protein [Luteimonas galliterrae]